MHTGPIGLSDKIKMPRLGARGGRSDSLTSSEQGRRRLVAVVLWIYMLLIFEGSIRKWLLPQLSFFVFFIRDPFLIYAYFIATRHNLWPRNSALLVVFIVMSCLGALIGVLQLVLGDLDQTRLMLTIYGWRNYFLYAPLALLIGAHFRFADIVRVFRWTLVLCVPIGILVAAQFWSPPNAPINVGRATESALQFHGLGLTGEHTRPMGTFSSGAGQIQFVASSFAIFLALLILPARDRPVSRSLLLIAAVGLAVCLALSGSRATVLHCALIALVAMSLGIFGRGLSIKSRAIALPLLLGTALVVFYPILFPKGFETFMARWEVAAIAENKSFQGGVLGRALYGLVDFVRLLDDTPLLGYGLGIGGNASTTLGVKLSGVNPVSLAETDWARHIVDLGPVFGPAYILFRVGLTLWLGVIVLRATRRGAGPLPLLLYAYVGYVLLLGQITGQGAINAYAWLFAGFCLAAATDPARAASPQARADILPRRSAPCVVDSWPRYPSVKRRV